MAKILTLTLNPALDLTVELDRLSPGEVIRTGAQHSHAAGKGLNVAQVLADLGHELTVSGFLGSANAQPFEALFAARGFTDAFVRVPGETRVNLKLAERDGRITDLNGPGPKVDESARAELLARLAQVAPGHDAVVVAGSLPRGVEPDWLRELLERLKAMGLKVAFDCSGAALAAGLDAGPWLVKPNTEELAQVFGPLPTPDAVRQLRTRGVEHVVLSDGAAGVTWFGPDATWHARPPKVNVASTVGAGDSLLAGMVHGLLGASTADETLRQATAIAALAVTQIGFGIQDRDALQRLLDQVQVQPQSPEQEATP